MSGNDWTKRDRAITEGTAQRELREAAALSHGTRVSLPTFYRFVILEAFPDPTIIDDDRAAHLAEVVGVSNPQFAKVLPRNSIVGQRVLDARNASSAPPMFLFPFFPPAISLPCQPGEHVWVMFEDRDGKNADLGYWLCRIVEPGFVEDANHTHSARRLDPSFFPTTKGAFDGAAAEYEFQNGAVIVGPDGARAPAAETAFIPGEEDAYVKLMTESDGGKLASREAVPRYKKRPGDIALEGSNNALVVVGRDRRGPIGTRTDDDEKGPVIEGPGEDDVLESSGAIDIVTGRGQTTRTLGNVTTNSLEANELEKASDRLELAEGDPDFRNDRSRVYVAQKTRVDDGFGLTAFNGTLSIGPFQGIALGGPTLSKVSDGDGDGAIVLKTDKIRLIARSDVEIIVSSYVTRDADGKIVDPGDVTEGYSAIVLKANGDIVLRPSKLGYLKLGGDDASSAILCTDSPAVATGGIVSGPPILTTMGGMIGGAVPAGPEQNAPAIAPGLGKFSSKCLIK